MNWKESGAKNQSEFDDWNKDICGIYCLKMAGDYFGKTNELSVWSLLNECRAFGGFRDENGERIGVFHKALAKTAKKNKFFGKITKDLTTDKLKKLLKKDYLVILSVNKNKIGKNLTGGHLILVLDYSEREKAFVLNDPDPILAKNGSSIHLPEIELDRISNKKGIKLKKRN